MRRYLTNPLAALALCLAALLASCAATPPRHAWEENLRGNTLVMLGELHDNPEHHRQRAAVLRRALEAGWRPAIAMEQFDRERQPDIERARREKPRDARHVINIAGMAADKTRGTWEWDFYLPFIELALQYDLPLIAANLSRADIGKIMKHGYPAVFDTPSLQTLGLANPLPADLHAAQELAITRGHCDALPVAMIPAMTRGQLARDAVIAGRVNEHADRGVVLLAGNSHINRDIGVPRWLSPALLARTFTVAYIENPPAGTSVKPFDAVVATAGVNRPDPCLAFRKHMQKVL